MKGKKLIRKNIDIPTLFKSLQAVLPKTSTWSKARIKSTETPSPQALKLLETGVAIPSFSPCASLPMIS